MNGVKQGDELRIKCKRIGLDERKRIPRLGFKIYAHDLKTSIAVTDARAARTTE